MNIAVSCLSTSTQRFQTHGKFVEILDPQSGKLVYANIVTGECSFTKPENAEIQQRNLDEDEWWELFDNNHKLPYYYNTKTMLTDWNRPTTGIIIPLVAIQNSSIGKRMSLAIQSTTPVRYTADPGTPEVPVPEAQMKKLTIAKTQPDYTYTIQSQRITDSIKAKSFAEAAKNARSGGISQPVQNLEAAILMNPFSNQVETANGTDRPSLPRELKHNISEFKLDGFASKYFSQHRKGIFRRKVPIEQMLVYHKTLSGPMMVLNKVLHKDALKCFKYIYKVMDKVIDNREEEIQNLLNKGIHHGELRDEIYVQIMKQLTDNPSRESTFKGWSLLCVVSIAFPPSKNFEEYVKSFCEDHYEIQEDKIGIVAQFCHKKILRICKTGPRGKTPSIVEIERALEAPFHSALFGESLEEIMKEQNKKYPELDVPRILPFLANAILDLNGCQTEGIFRVPGDADSVTDLKCRLEKDNYDVTGITDPNVPSSLLKLWLRDLSEPLIPTEFYSSCVQVGQSEEKEGIAIDAYDILKKLPDINHKVCDYMIRFLKIFGDPIYHKITKMNVHNLGMVFAPNFLRCPSDNPTTIFENTKFEQAFLRSLITSKETN